MLDDCTASLDARNEDRFWSDLQRDFPEATVFVVSHRIATILRAETILVLDEGRLIDIDLRDRYGGIELFDADGLPLGSFRIDPIGSNSSVLGGFKFGLQGGKHHVAQNPPKFGQGEV